MVVAHFGTAAQPGSPAPVNITAVEIVLHEPCRKRPAGIRTATGPRAESVSVYEGGEKKKTSSSNVDYDTTEQTQ